MAVAEVETSTQTNSGGTSVVVTKPSGTSTGHLMLAFFVSNSQNCTPPSGWTEISDDVTEVFRLQVFYKVAGGSEPSNYTFSVGSSAPLVCAITTLSGIDSSNPIDIEPEVEADSGNHSEPYTTPSVSGGLGGALVYFRAARRESTTPLTFTGAGATELADVGQAGSSVSYSLGVYLANSGYTTDGTKTGHGITCSATETHNIVGTLGVRAVAIPGTVDVQLPLLEFEAEGNPAIPGYMDFGLKRLEFEAEGFYGDTEGTLDVQVPIEMEMEGGSPPAGTLDVVIEPVFHFPGETRRFAENVVSPEREERCIIVTEESIRLGKRDSRFGLLRVTLPSITYQFTANAPPFGFPPPDIEVTVNRPFWDVDHFMQAIASGSAEAYGITMLSGKIPDAGEVSVDVTANDPTVLRAISVDAGLAEVEVDVKDVRGTQAPAGDGSVEVEVNDAEILVGKAAFAGLAEVTCHN
jgi:hypothetical protein